MAQDTGLARGDAVVTGFSGIKPSDKPLPPGANPLDHFFIDLEGPSAQIMSLNGLGGQPNGQLVSPATKRQIKAGEVGQVFAVTLDDGQGGKVPNIYLGATSAYGIHVVGPDNDGNGQPDRIKTGQAGAQFMAGQFGPAPDGNPGTIWRVDGATGDVTAFATLPGNSGAGIGDIVFDKRSRNFYASDLDQGLIYRVGSDGLVSNSFDHGVNGRPAKGLAPLADDGKVMAITSPQFDSQNPDTWGITQDDRMVYGMAIHDGRLYYAVTGGLQVWSIGLADDGDFAGDARWEVDATKLVGDGPITDIAFDKDGHMLLAQRGKARGSYDYSIFAETAKSSVVRYAREQPDDPATPSAWREDAVEYAIGMSAPHRFANGGIALGYAHDEAGSPKPGTCSTMLWSTGSRLRSSENPGETDAGNIDSADVHGLQGNHLGLARPQNVPPAQSYFADYDNQFGDPEKAGHLGDVEIWQPCDDVDFAARDDGTLPPGYWPPGEPPELPPEFPPPVWEYETNLELKKRAMPQTCWPLAGGYACRFQVRIRNTGPDFYFGPLLVSDTLPAAPAGAVMGFGPNPPWSCWNAGAASYKCHRGATFLAPGASVGFNAVVWVPNSYQPCHLQNIAAIEWAPGGTRWNTNPVDDIDSATALIPAAHCPPPAGPTNLSLVKDANPQTCMPNGGDFRCRYRVTITNTGPGVYNGPVQVEERPATGTSASFSWPCVAAGANYNCTHPAVNLLPTQQLFLWAWVDVPMDVARQHSCKIENKARITFAPGGTFQNTNAGDDADAATALINASICPTQLKSVVPPPPFTCPPGYRLSKGKCVRKNRQCPEGSVGKYPNCRTVIVDPPRKCPKGTVGRYPRCRDIEPPKVCPPGTTGRYPRCREIEPPKVCPPGTTGRYPRCRDIEPPKVCPPNTYGKYPRCLPKVCGHGLVGKWPNCKRPEVCPPNTYGKYPRCKPKVCGHGLVGKWPNCKRPEVCPPNTYGKYPRCKPKRCALGTVGKWPNCRKIIRPKFCPPGTRGKWPNCRKIIIRPRRCPPGTFGRWPNCKRHHIRPQRTRPFQTAPRLKINRAIIRQQRIR